jgi:hypothetical protein
MKKTGVEYYSFGAFERKGRSVTVTFGVESYNYAAGDGWDSFTEFICRKASGKWKVKAGESSASVSESYSAKF